MDTAKLKKFAQFARRSLIDQVSSKLALVLAEDSAARRENAAAINKLEEQISEHGEKQVIEKIAYIWFNRFCALRFMDVNRYTRIGLVSPAEGQFQPEILAEAKMGHIDEDTVPEKIRQQIFSLLGGTAPSQDPQAEAYRLLIVAACNDYHKAMPYLFERIADYTELLMPDDLLSGSSILAYTREAMTPDVCQDVEVIGWLYQFYISEKKDAVFDGLKKNKKITPENIPAATQLFTPHWIVRYLVENSLGRLWMLNHPNSRLVEKMEYFITTEHTENTEKEGLNSVSSVCSVVKKDFLVVNSPEEIKVCDPACGSGHMLVYAFDLLYAIYEEEGVDPAEIPEKILTHNLYGIEIDERAGELAAFALTMKARAKQRRFFRKPVQPNICVLENIHFDETEINEYMDFVGQDIFTLGLKATLSQFEEADNFGSLIRPEVTDVQGMLEILNAKDVSSHLFYSLTHEKVLQALKQADYLSPKYHVVIANPPYMNSGGMNGLLKKWLSEYYSNAKADLMTAFMERAQTLTQPNSFWGMINLPSWMFLGSFEKMRKNFLECNSIASLIHLGRGVFGSDFGSVAFVVKNCSPTTLTSGIYRRLFEKHVHVRDVSEIEQLFLNRSYGQHCILQRDLLEIPGNPISYWISSNQLSLFKGKSFADKCYAGFGIKTGNNDIFMRFWNEVSHGNIEFSCDGKMFENRWYPCASGGSYRKWYGNQDLVVDYQHEGRHIEQHAKKNGNSFGFNGKKFYFRKSITWPKLTAGANSFRATPTGHIFDGVGLSAFFDSDTDYNSAILCLNSKIIAELLPLIAPTLSLTSGDFLKLPFLQAEEQQISLAEKAISHGKADWNSFETSWDFTSLPLLNPDYRQPTLKATYQKLRAHWQQITQETQRLEQENNCIFIDAYGLQDELTPEVPLNEITLTCNPHYRYGNNKNDEELEALLLADTMKEYISYAVGCMFGRYALDKPGLILANQGETTEDYYKKIKTTEHTENTEKDISNNSVSYKKIRTTEYTEYTENTDAKTSVSSVYSVVKNAFPPDDDNVIPMLDGDWFTDDITERFCKFLKVTFGEEHYEENLTFIEKALGKDIRKYFLKDFYSDHVKRYKKRPIYWLFSSPKGTFNALIYMHRYRPDTVSVVLNDYLREFRTKLSAHKNHLEAVSISSSASAGEKTKALKDIETHRKMIDELDVYEREVLYPLATEQVEIDLDDGIKVNYQKFGEALKKIPGLAGKGEE